MDSRRRRMRPELSRVLAPPARQAPHRRFLPTPIEPPVAPGLYQDEPATCRRDLRAFLPILVHLGLLLAVARVYRLEGRAFQILLTLAAVALPIHYLLPFKQKMQG